MANLKTPFFISMDHDDQNKNKAKTNIRNIQVGKFYLIHDKSKHRHPGYILEKDDQNNRYLVARFDSDKANDVPKFSRGVRHITQLLHPTEKNIVRSYVRNRPFLCKRKEIGIELKDLSINPEDLELVKSIAKNNPELSGSLRKKSPR